MLSDSPLIRMSPLQPSELPAHPSLASTDSEARGRPDLIPFVTALLDEASSILDPTQFNLTFKSHSHRSSPPSNTDVESLVATVSSSTIAESVKWTDPQTGIGRQKPRDIPSESWFARRSYHPNVSTKTNPATASWPEFVFGLRDNHSRNEMEFTPTLYDARHILDWNAELTTAASAAAGGAIGEQEQKYTHTTLAVYEMCHEIPFPLQPRCFAVLVATASVSATKFIAATVPVNLGSFEGAFYSTGRNRTEGEDGRRRKQVVMGLYTAVESCVLMNADTSNAVAAEGEATAETMKESEQVEWVMATASDAKGNLPMTLQKSTMPSQVAKDVGFFLSWIHTVDDAVLRGEKEYISSSGEGERKRSRTGSSAR